MDGLGLPRGRNHSRPLSGYTCRIVDLHGKKSDAVLCYMHIMVYSIVLACRMAVHIHNVSA